jgi:hypothetical protein
MLPLFALALACILHWDALANPLWNWQMRPQAPPWAWGVWMALCAGLVMIIEELARCLRAARLSR